MTDVSLNFSNRLLDRRFALYCIPVVGSLLRIATAVNTIGTVIKRDSLSADLKGVSYQERWHGALDVVKWFAITILTMELFMSIGPVIAVATIAFYLIACGCTGAEQVILWLSADRVSKLPTTA